MNFKEITSKFEDTISGHLDFELLEQLYAPYAFGSGFVAYRVKGKNLRIVYDGKDSRIEVFITPKHSKYPEGNWKQIFTGTTKEFFHDGIKLVITELTG